MSAVLDAFVLLQHQHALEIEVADLEAHLPVLLDPYTGARRLEEARRELAFLRRQLDGWEEPAPPSSGPPATREARFDLTASEAADRLGMTRPRLHRLIHRTPPPARPCIDVSTGAQRLHLRFDAAQLDHWAKEKPWLASDPMPEAGSSAGVSPFPAAPTASSARGSATSARRRPRSTAKTPSAPSGQGMSGFLPIDDPDLAALM